MENKIPLIKETVVAQIDKTELDLIVIDELLGASPDGHDYDWVYDEDSNIKYWREGAYISVDMLQGVLDDLKVFGTTHVQIFHHGDHFGYYFTGVRLEIMDDAEMQKRRKKQLEASIKHNEMALGLEEKELEEKRKLIEKQKEELNNWK